MHFYIFFLKAHRRVQAKRCICQHTIDLCLIHDMGFAQKSYFACFILEMQTSIFLTFYMHHYIIGIHISTFSIYSVTSIYCPSQTAEAFQMKFKIKP